METKIDRDGLLYLPHYILLSRFLSSTCSPRKFIYLLNEQFMRELLRIYSLFFLLICFFFCFFNVKVLMLLSCFLQQAYSSFYVPTPISLSYKTMYISAISWLCFAFRSPIALVVYSHRTSNCFAIVRRKKQVQSRTAITKKSVQDSKLRSIKENREEQNKRIEKKLKKRIIRCSSIIISFNA